MFSICVLNRVYFLIIIIILIVGEAVSVLPKDKRLKYVRQGFLRNWFIRAFLYIFVVASLMQQHMYAKRDGLMRDTRIHPSDWREGAMSAFWGLFNWSSLLFYLCYLILGLYRMDTILDNLEQEYEEKTGRYDPNPEYM